MLDRLRLEVLLGAVDKLTGPMRKVQKTTQEASQRLDALNTTAKKLGQQKALVESFNKQREAASAAATKLRQAQTQLQALGAVGTTSAAQMAKAQKAVDKASSAYNKQKTKVIELRQALNQAGIGNASQAQARLQASLAATNAQIDVQRRKLAQAAAAQERFDKLKNQRNQALATAGMVVAGGAATLAVGQRSGSGIARLLQPGVEFDTAMSKVQALSRLDKDSKELAMLRQQAKALGASTMFSATEAAQGQGFLAMAGFKPEDIKAAMPGMLDMAKAGDMELGRTADISSNILSAFGIDPSNMGQVADVLTKTFTTSNTTLEMLGNTMSYVGPVARAAGVDLQTTATMAGLLGNVGIQGEKGGTALRAMLLRLSAPTGGAAKMLKKLGVQTRDAKGNVLGVTDVLTNLAKQTEKMGSAQRLEALKTIFGEEPAAAMAELIEKSGSGGIIEYLDKVKDSAGAAGKTAKVMADNLTGDMDELSSTWEDVRIQLFETNAGEIRAWVQKITGAIRAVGDWLRENPIATQWLVRGAIGFAVLTTAVGALMIPLGLILAKMALLRFAFGMVGVTLPGIAGVFKAVGGGLVRLLPVLARFAPMLLRLLGPVGLLITAGIMLYNNWDGVVGGAKLLWEDLLGFLARIGQGIAAGFGRLVQAGRSVLNSGVSGWAKTLLNFSPFGLLWRGITAALSALGIEVPAKFQSLGAAVVDGLIGGIGSKLAALRDTVMQMGGQAWQAFKEKLGIHSPSRVFMQLGGHISEGAALGIERSQKLAASAALGLAAASMAPMASAGPALASSAGAGAGAGSAAGSSYNITITINAPAGADPQAIAAAVRMELDKRERYNRGRVLSQMSDME
ncbi:phage tail tape measure protein [Comamonas denitrificans]|uniref:phage tail tape measure protein n=1 Tax=Comamonas denitrificans TaxID=117506 RepID=UPI00361FFCA3